MDIFKVVSNGDIQMIKYKVKHGADIHVKDKYGGTLLHTAAERGHVEVFVYLTQLGLDAHDQDSEGRTVLHDACLTGQYEMVKYICTSYNGITKIWDKANRTTLGYSAAGGNVDIFKYLVQYGLHLYNVDSEEATVLHLASLAGKYELVKYLVTTYPDLKSEVNRQKRSALHYCAQGGDVEIFKFLVDQGLKVYSVDADDATVLHFACLYCKYELVQYILATYPDLKNKVNKRQRTALHFCAAGGDVDIFKLLVSQGLDVHSVTAAGSTVLHVACLNSKYELVKHIVKLYPEMVTSTTISGKTPLYLAVENNDQNIILFLKEHQTAFKGTKTSDETSNFASIASISDIEGASQSRTPSLHVDSIGTRLNTTLHLSSDDGDQVKIDSFVSSDHSEDRPVNLTRSVFISSDEDPDNMSSSLFRSSDSDYGQDAILLDQKMALETDKTIIILNQDECHACQKKAKNKVNKASWYCKNCGDRLCDECKSYHDVFSSTRIHMVIPFRPPCDVCEEGDLADWFCVDCAEYLCQDCRAYHYKMKRTKKHILIRSADHIVKETICSKP